MRAGLCVLLLLSMTGFHPALAQRESNESGEPSITFKSATNMVLVPVIVTDKKGNTIGGLKPEDFRLLENGKERKIASVEETVTTTSVSNVARENPNEFTNQVDTSKNGRVTIILLDLLNTAFSEQVRVRKDALKFLSEHLQPGEPIALLSLGPEGVRVLHDFTADPEELVEALKQVVPRRSVSENLAQDKPFPDAPMTMNRNTRFIISSLQSFENVDSSEGDELEPKNIAGLPGTTQRIIPQAFRNQQEFQKKSAFEITLRTMRVIADAFAGIPGRKSLIWASSGVPDLASLPTANQAFRTEYLVYESTWAALSDANIAVYPLDLSTLTTERYSNPSLQYPIAPLRTVSTPVSNLEEFAKRTGGRLCVAKDDIEDCFRTAAQDASHYYQLAYYADSKGSDGWRKITVLLDHQDALVHARNGYFFHRNVKSDPSRDTDMKIAMASPLESNAVPLKLHWLEQASAGDKVKVNFELWMPGTAATIDTGRKNRIDLAIIGLAKTFDGKVEDTFEQQLAGDLPQKVAAEVTRQGISNSGSFTLAPGKYAVRFVVRDSQSGRVGTVTAPLDVRK